MTAFAHHFSFEFRAGLRNRALVLLNILLPLGFFLLGGALMTGVNPTFYQTLIPAMVFFAVLVSTMLGMPDVLVAARNAGIFRSFHIHGIPELSILAMPALSTLFRVVIVALIMVLLAPPLFGAEMPVNIWAFMLSFLLLVFACLGLGLLLGVVSPNANATVMMAQGIFVPSMLIGGLMMPTSLLPDALRSVSWLLPTSHAMNIANALAYGREAALSPYISALALLAGGVLAIGLAAYLFSWDQQHEMRRGSPWLGLLALLPYVLVVLAQAVGGG